MDDVRLIPRLTPHGRLLLAPSDEGPEWSRRRTSACGKRSRARGRARVLAARGGRSGSGPAAGLCLGVWARQPLRHRVPHAARCRRARRGGPAAVGGRPRGARLGGHDDARGPSTWRPRRSLPSGRRSDRPSWPSRQSRGHAPDIPQVAPPGLARGRAGALPPHREPQGRRNALRLPPGVAKGSGVTMMPMADESSPSDVLFEVVTPLNFRVHVTRGAHGQRDHYGKTSGHGDV